MNAQGRSESQAGKYLEMTVIFIGVDVLNPLYYLCAVDEKRLYNMAEKTGIDELCIKEILKERGLKMKGKKD